MSRGMPIWVSVDVFRRDVSTKAANCPPTTNTAESEAAATPAEHTIKATINKHPEEAPTTDTAESQAAATPTEHTMMVASTLTQIDSLRAVGQLV